ncbi:MAG: hypothetical protein KF689_01295 [Gemmatimonadaceae bacterium]|nr:hypothetical protein [Gemmatimonadaceae bacterium]MCW5826565.1 hypothetical protein [Gemmatimonadaceae bacterium]
MALTLFASLLSCGREITGPGGRGVPVALHFLPDFRPMMVEEVDGTMHSVAGLVPFTRVRIELRRSDNTVAASSVVEFPADADSIPLNILVPLSSEAGTEGEVLSAFLRYINSAGDTVFAGGPVTVLARRDRNAPPPPVVVPLAPTVPGATFARIDIDPDTAEANSGQSVAFTATGYDGQDVVVPNAIIGFLSRNPALAAVPSLASGTVNLVGARGSTWIIAQSLTGVRDSALVKILPVPSGLVKASGDGQSALTGAEFAQKLRVRVIASDALGVAGVSVNFAVTSGGGSVSEPTVVSDADGYAEVTWTAGAAAGAGSVTASVASPALNAVFTGTQVASAASSLTFESQPSNITGGEDLPGIEVAVRNGANQIITTFGGPVTLGLSGGSAGAALVGTTTVNAVEGVATFTGLTVNKGGTGYRLVATHEQLPPAQSNLFDVAAPPAVTAVLVSGGGQSAPANTQLADSIRVRFLDTFEQPVVGATVTFTVQAGGGSLSPTSAVTDIDGRVGVAWTLGEAGAQQMRAAIGGVSLNVNATLVASEGISLFAGFDYTYVPIGGSRGIPIYLTNPSPTPVTVTLTVDEPIAQWSSSTVNIPAGQTVVTPGLQGNVEGVTWVRMSSEFGDDSVLVTVVQSSVGLLEPQYPYFETSDTVRLLVSLTSPAGPGGVLVTVTSLDTTLALVAGGTGLGRPAEACVSAYYYYCGGGGAVQSGDVTASASGPLNLVGTPGESVEILVPEGQLFGNLTVVTTGEAGRSGWVDLDISAPNHAGGWSSLGVFPPVHSVYWEDYYLTSTVGAGQYFRIRSTISGRSPLKGERVITVTSRHPAIAGVPAEIRLGLNDYASPPFAVRGLSEGSTYVVFESPGLPADSIPVVVTAPKLLIDDVTGTYLPQQSRGTVRAGLTSIDGFSSFRVHSAVGLTWRTDNPSVILLEQTTSEIPADQWSSSIAFQTLGLGSGYIVAEIDGVAADSVEITTYTAAPSTFTFSTTGGVGVITPISFSIPNVMSPTGLRAVAVTSLNTAVAQVLTPTVQVGASNSNGTAYVVGTGVGSTQIQFSGANLSPMNVTVTVSRGRTLVNASGSAADSVVRTAAAFMSDGSTTRAALDTVRARLRSSDPAVIAVVDSIVTFVPSSLASNTQGKYRPVAPGSARLWLVPEDPAYDSSSTALLTVNPYVLQTTSSQWVGQRLATSFTAYRNGPPQGALPITNQRTGPGEVEVTGFSGEFAAGATSSFGWVVGRALGVDSLITSAPGYNSDTLAFEVVESWARLELYGDPRAGQLLTDIGAILSEFGSYVYRTAGEPIKLRVLSLDESKAVVETDSIVFEEGDYYPTYGAAVRFLEAGTATLVVEDVEGIIRPDTVTVFVNPRSLTGGYYYNDVYDRMSIGMGQKTDDYDVYVSRGYASPEPMWVYLHSTQPSLVQVPDSVLIAAYDDYAYIPITAGDTVGSARVIASAPGYNEYELDVIVTRGEIEHYAYVSAAGFPLAIELYVVDALTRSTRLMASPVPMRFTTDRPDLLDTAGTSFTYPADAYYASPPGPMALATGGAVLRVEDDRPPGFASMLTSTSSLEIGQAYLSSSADALVRLTPGTRRQPGFSVYTSLDYVPVTATASALAGRFAASPGTIEFNSGVYGSYNSLELTGLTSGTDTLVLSAPNLKSDTTLIVVEAGYLTLLQGPQAIVVGDSALITLRLRDADQNAVFVTESTTFSFAVDTTFAISDGTGTVSTIIVGEDGELLTFWVRAQTPGQSSITVTSPNFRTFTLPLYAVERP